MLGIKMIGKNLLKKTLRINVDKLLLFCLFSMFVAIMVVLVWASFRSVGAGYEGTYILAARYPSEIKEHVSAIFILTNLLFKLVGYKLAYFRLLGVVLLMISTYIFWKGFITNLSSLGIEKNITVKWGYLLFFMIGSLVAYQWNFMTPSYYLLISIAVNLYSGSYLMAISLRSNEFKVKIYSGLCFLIVGISIGLMFLIKFPVGIAVAVLTFLGLMLRTVVVDKMDILIINFLSVVLGFFITILVFLSILPPSFDLMANFKDGLHLYSFLPSYTFSTRFFSYAIDMFVILLNSLRLFWMPYLSFIIYTIYLKFFVRNSSMNFNYLILVSVVLAGFQSVYSSVFFYESREISGTPYLFYYSAWIILSISLLIVFGKINCKTYYFNGNAHLYIRQIIILLSLPILGVLGTNNPIYNVLPYNLTPWFGLIIGVFILLGHFSSMHRLLPFLVVLIISFYSTNQIIQGVIKRPFNVETSGLEWFNVTVKVSENDEMLMGKREAKHIMKLRQILYGNGFVSGGDIIGFNYIPRAIYEVGGKSPGHPVSLVGAIEYNNYTKFALTFTSTERLANSFLISNDASKETVISDILKTRGIDFPDDYCYLGSSKLNAQIFKVWKAKRYKEGGM